MSSPVWIMCDLAIESVTFIIVIKKWFGLGFGARGHFMTVSKRHVLHNLWRFFKKTSRGVIYDAQYMTKFEIVIDNVLWYSFSDLWWNFVIMDQQISCSGAATAVDCRYRVVHHEIAPLLPSKLSLDLMGRRKRVTWGQLGSEGSKESPQLENWILVLDGNRRLVLVSR